MADKFEIQFQTLLKRIAEEFKKCSSLEDLETLKENLEKEIESAKESGGLSDEDKEKLDNAASKEDLENTKSELESEIEAAEVELPEGNVVLRESAYWADQYVAVHGSSPQQQGPQGNSYTYGLEVVCNSTGTPQHIQLYYASTQGNSTTYNRSSSNESDAFTVGDLAVIGHIYSGSGNYSTAANFAMSNPEDLQVGDYVVYTESGWDWSFSQKAFDAASTEDLGSVKEELEAEISGIINDSSVSTNSGYSSSKVSDLIQEAANQVKNDLLDGAGEAYDTLKELADLIVEDQDAIKALETISAGHVKYDGAQQLTEAQKAQARENIGASSSSSDGDYLPLSGGTLTGDLVIGSKGLKLQASDGHIVLPSGIEIY